MEIMQQGASAAISFQKRMLTDKAPAAVRVHAAEFILDLASQGAQEDLQARINGPQVWRAFDRRRSTRHSSACLLRHGPPGISSYRNHSRSISYEPDVAAFGRPGWDMF